MENGTSFAYLVATSQRLDEKPQGILGQVYGDTISGKRLTWSEENKIAKEAYSSFDKFDQDKNGFLTKVELVDSAKVTTVAANEASRYLEKNFYVMQAMYMERANEGGEGISRRDVQFFRDTTTTNFDFKSGAHQMGMEKAQSSALLYGSYSLAAGAIMGFRSGLGMGLATAVGFAAVAALITIPTYFMRRENSLYQYGKAQTQLSDLTALK